MKRKVVNWKQLSEVLLDPEFKSEIVDMEFTGNLKKSKLTGLWFEKLRNIKLRSKK